MNISCRVSLSLLNKPDFILFRAGLQSQNVPGRKTGQYAKPGAKAVITIYALIFRAAYGYRTVLS